MLCQNPRGMSLIALLRFIRLYRTISPLCPQEVRVPAPAGFLQRRSDDDMEVAASDPVSALFHASPSAAETPRVAISSGYARTSLAS